MFRREYAPYVVAAMILMTLQPLLTTATKINGHYEYLQVDHLFVCALRLAAATSAIPCNIGGHDAAGRGDEAVDIDVPVLDRTCGGADAPEAPNTRDYALYDASSHLLCQQQPHICHPCLRQLHHVPGAYAPQHLKPHYV